MTSKQCSNAPAARGRPWCNLGQSMICAKIKKAKDTRAEGGKIIDVTMVVSWPWSDLHAHALAVVKLCSNDAIQPQVPKNILKRVKKKQEKKKACHDLGMSSQPRPVPSRPWDDLLYFLVDLVLRGARRGAGSARSLLLGLGQGHHDLGATFVIF